MSASRLSILFVAVLLVTTAAIIAQKAISNANPTFIESKEQVLREYRLGERYGVLPEDPTLFSAEQIQREYILGERYGEVPEVSTLFNAEQFHREYTLGERYGVTPQEYANQQTRREYWLGERYGQTP